MTTESSTVISRRRRPRGRYPKTQEGATPKRQKRIPEYLEPDEVNAIIRAAPNPKAKLLMLEQWRAGLRVSEAHPATAWRWVQAALKRAEELGAVAPGKRVGTHTLRHSYARHLLMNGIPINYLSRWLGHSSIQTTLIYLELVPDPTGSLASVP